MVQLGASEDLVLGVLVGVVVEPGQQASRQQRYAQQRNVERQAVVPTRCRGQGLRHRQSRCCQQPEEQVTREERQVVLAPDNRSPVDNQLHDPHTKRADKPADCQRHREAVAREYPTEAGKQTDLVRSGQRQHLQRMR